MVRLAFKDEPGIAVSLIDSPRSDGKPNYTIDVLQEVKRSLSPHDELFCLLGADSFLTLKRWHHAEALLFVCDFIVAGRPGFSLDVVSAELPNGVRAACEPVQSQLVATCELSNGLGQRSHIHLMRDLHLDISATEIRAALQGERTASEVLAPEVVRYIHERDLYR